MEGTRSFHIPSLRSSFQNSALSSPHKSNLFTGWECVPQYNWVSIVPALTSLGKGRQTYGSPPMLKALSLVREFRMNRIYFVIIGFLLIPDAYSGDHECVRNMVTGKGIEVTISKLDSCVKLKCEEVNARNIQSALALCHQTEKDHIYCGWNTQVSIDNVSMNLEENGRYSVDLVKCGT